MYMLSPGADLVIGSQERLWEKSEQFKHDHKNAVKWCVRLVNLIRDTPGFAAEMARMETKFWVDDDPDHELEFCVKTKLVD